MSRTSCLRRGFVLLTIACAVGATTSLLACSDDDAGADDDGIPTNSVYVPAEAAAQNPIPPGVTPRKDEDQPPPTPKPDASTPTDSSTPKQDSSTPDAT